MSPRRRSHGRFLCRARASAALACVLLAACGRGAGESERWNVLLVTLDTTRADRLSCYGYPVSTTPNIDGLARVGTLFERAISTAGITPMAHSSILTGLNNYRHGMRVFYSDEVSHRLEDSVETLPEILGRHGWRTGASVSAYPVSEIYNLNQGFDFFDTGLDLSELDVSTGQQKHEDAWHQGRSLSTQRRSDETIDRAVGWLEENGDRPWCLWVHLFDVHDYSIVPPQEWARENFALEYDPRASLQNPQWREAMYDPELRYQDEQLGRLLDWVRDSGQAERTLIVVTADHGQGLKDGLLNHAWQKHRLLYDWCIRVPLVLVVPGMPGGKRVPTQVRTIDILPTLLDLLDLPGPEMEGRSLLPLAQGATESEPRIAYADALNIYDAHSPGPRNLPPTMYDNLYAVSDGRWKLVWHEREPENSQLYDLEQDPGELRNVAALHPEEVERLHRYLIEWDAMRVEAPDAGEAAPDASALRGLGYDGGDEGGYGGEPPGDASGTDQD